MEQFFIKKPIKVEAIQFTNENKDMVYSWCRDIQMNITPSFDKDNNPILLVPTLEGEMICAIGDWLIKEPFPIDWRKIYPCKPDIFEKTYQKQPSVIRRVEEFRYENGKANAKASAYMKKTMYDAKEVERLMELYALPLTAPINPATEEGKEVNESCPECGEKVVHIRQFSVCEGFGCKWQRENSNAV